MELPAARVKFLDFLKRLSYEGIDGIGHIAHDVESKSMEELDNLVKTLKESLSCTLRQVSTARTDDKRDVEFYFDLNKSRDNIGKSVRPFKEFGKQGIDGLIEQLSDRILKCTDLKAVQNAEKRLKDGLEQIVIDMRWKTTVELSEFEIPKSDRCYINNHGGSLTNQKKCVACMVAYHEVFFYDDGNDRRRQYYRNTMEVSGPLMPTIMEFLSKLRKLLGETIEMLPEDETKRDGANSDSDSETETETSCGTSSEPKPPAYSWNRFRVDSFQLAADPMIAQKQYKIACFCMRTDLSPFYRNEILKSLYLMSTDYGLAIEKMRAIDAAAGGCLSTVL
jgi:hypothetical protein